MLELILKKIRRMRSETFQDESMCFFNNTEQKTVAPAANAPMKLAFSPERLCRLTFLQLVLDHHQEGHADHEQVEAEADLAELSGSSSAHFPHHVLVGPLSADGRRVAQDDESADEEHQAYLQGREEFKGSRQCKTQKRF